MNMNNISVSVNYNSLPTPPAEGGNDGNNMQQLLSEIEQMLPMMGGTPGGSTPSPSMPSPSMPTTLAASTPSAGSSSPNVTAAYNKLMSDLSANGTSGSTLQSDAAAYQSAAQGAGGGGADVNNAVNNMVTSLNNDTFSQQGSQGALENAASQDGMTGVLTPQIDGATGMNSQNMGLYAGNSAIQNGAGGKGSLGANTSILSAEMSGGAPTSQIVNNATALAKEATNAGDTGLAQAAQNIANSENDGSYNASASLNALNTQLGAAPNAG